MTSLISALPVLAITLSLAVIAVRPSLRDRLPIAVEKRRRS